MKKRTGSPSRTSEQVPSVLVHIEKPIYGGAFLSRVEGRATFVPLTLPGEQARVRIVEEKRGYATAEAEEIVTPAPERIVAGCRHFGTCGGCSYQHTGYETQLALKKAILRETLERGGVRAPEHIDVLAGDPWQYRNRIRLAFDAAGRVGYRGRRSHGVVPIDECPIASQLLVRAALSAAETVRDARPGFGPTEISLFCNADETELLASIFARNSAVRGFDQFILTWKERIPTLSGAELVMTGSRDQAPERTEGWGSTSLNYRVGEIDYRVDLGAFFQVNRWLIDVLADRVCAGRGGSLAWDLFAGVGLFARRLAGGFEHVVAIESAPTATSALTKNLEHTNGEAVKAETLAFLKSQGKRARPELIVVDPPRTGLGSETTSLLAGIAAPTLVYVSCDPATLARDIRALTGSGYSISSVTLADLFPQTFHLETVVELQRS